MLDNLAGVRDRVLDGAGLQGGETLLDVGCGEGLIGFGALERGAGHVVFSDISDDLLDFCREAAEALGLAERCTFVPAAADELEAIEDASVGCRRHSFGPDLRRREGARVRRVLSGPAAGRAGGDLGADQPLRQRGAHVRLLGLRRRRPERARGPDRGVFREIQPLDDPMLDFDERDLIRFAESAGFFPVNLELRAEIRPLDPSAVGRVPPRLGEPEDPNVRRGDGPGAHARGAGARDRASAAARRRGTRRLAHGPRPSGRDQTGHVVGTVPRT